MTSLKAISFFPFEWLPVVILTSGREFESRLVLLVMYPGIL